MTSITLSANHEILEQILEFAKNLSLKNGEEIKIQSPNDERYKNYEADIEAYERGELETYSLEELELEMEKW